MSMKYKSSTPYGGLSERRALSCLNLSPLTTSLLTPCSNRLAANDYSRLYSGTGSRRKPKSPARKLEFASSTKVVKSRVRPDSTSDVAVASSASNNTENHSFGTTIMKAVGMIFSGLFFGIVALLNIAYLSIDYYIHDSMCRQICHGQEGNDWNKGQVWTCFVLRVILLKVYPWMVEWYSCSGLKQIWSVSVLSSYVILFWLKM